MGTAPGDATDVDHDAVERWLASLSALIAELTERWELELEDPLASSSLGYVVGATRAGSEPVVLKLTYPDGWFPERVATLLAWDGEGAVELIDHDPRGAMLLERAVPGTPLGDEPDERALPIAVDVLQRLWISPPEGITSVTEEVGRWVASFRDRNDALGRPLEPVVIDDAEDRMRALVASPVQPVLLHGDLQVGNVVAAQREPWLAISPHPLAGDPAFDVAVVILERAVARAAELLGQRFSIVAASASCEPHRLAAWILLIATDDALSAAASASSDATARDVAIVRAALALGR